MQTIFCANEKQLMNWFLRFDKFNPELCALVMVNILKLYSDHKAKFLTRPMIMNSVVSTLGKTHKVPYETATELVKNMLHSGPFQHVKGPAGGICLVG